MMRRIVAVVVVLMVLAPAGGCALSGGHDAIRPSGSARYFLEQLDHADAAADYITLPRSLADTLPNRTYASRDQPGLRLTWTKAIVVGRVTGVSAVGDHRVSLRIKVEQSFPASQAHTVEVLVAGAAEDEHRYLASAASLGRVVLGVDSYRDDKGREQKVVAMTSQLIGIVDDQDRISYPLLSPSDFGFVGSGWDRHMTTLAGLRHEAARPARTIVFGAVHLG